MTLTIFLMIALVGYSQSIAPDIEQLIVPRDSVLVPFIDEQEAVKAYIELSGFQGVDSLNRIQEAILQRENMDLRTALNNCQELDSLNTYRVIPDLRSQFNDVDRLYKDYKMSYRTEKTKKFLGTIGGIVAGMIVGFGLGELAAHH